MRWTRGYKSSNVEDRRGQGLGGLGGSSLALMPLFARFGLPGLLVGAALLYFSGGLGTGEQSPSALSNGDARPVGNPDEQAMVEFVSFVFDDAQSTWTDRFAQRGQTYRPARLVIFSGRTSSGCGTGQAAMGPFYCPADERVYIDLSFYRELRQRFGAPGDFAQAYVIAHEVAHHVQNLLGLSERVHRAPRSQQQGESGLSVRLELSADCLAGIWGNGTRKRNLLEAGDVEEAMTAAASIGDDRLQKQASGTVTPESWTHGSSEQRVRWFRRGFDQGSLEACDTFSPSNP